MTAQAAASTARISSAISPWCSSAARNAAATAGSDRSDPEFMPGMAQTDAGSEAGSAAGASRASPGPGPGPDSSRGVGVARYSAIVRSGPYRRLIHRYAHEGRGAEQRLRRHEQVKFGVEEVEQERDERGDEGAHDQDQAVRDPGRLRAVGLVGGDQEQGVDQQVAQADAVVVDAEPHAEQRVERVRQVPGDELVGQREHAWRR